jgi:hypothetical protein
MDHQNEKNLKPGHRRRGSNLLVHEVPEDENGYDADVEILWPDVYEEPDSDKSDGAASSTESEEQWRNELVKQMKSLSCHADARVRSNEDDSSRGRKRRSKDAFGASPLQTSTGVSSSQLEVTEIADDQESQPRQKRARRRSRRSKTADRLVHELLGSESEVGGDGGRRKVTKHFPEESVETETSRQDSLDDAMELG